jgi:hypothetical protein
MTCLNRDPPSKTEVIMLSQTIRIALRSVAWLPALHISGVCA